MAHILIVDNDVAVLDTFADLLRRKGHQVQTASTGANAVHALGIKPLPDCVVLDVDMPVMDGPEVAHRMLLHNAGQENIPVVLLSGRADLAAVAQRMGTPYLVAKIDEVDVFLAVVERALTERISPTSA